MTKLRNNQQGLGMIAMLVVVMMCIIGFVLVTVISRHNTTITTKSAAATKQSTTSSTKASVRSSAPTSQPTPVSPTAVPTTTPLTGNVIKLTELGIEIAVPDSLKDLVYATGPVDSFGMTSGTSAYLSTTALGKADANCVIDISGAHAGSILGPLGTLARINGTYPTNPPSQLGSLIVQGSGFYIVYKNTGYQCSSIPSVQAQVHSDITALKLDTTTVQFL